MLCKRNLLSVALSVGLLSLASGAMAQSVITGGATLPADLYLDIFPADAAPGGLQDFSYLPTGSGTGKTAVLTNNGTLFGAAGRSVPIAGSDAVLGTAELATYNTAHNAASMPSSDPAKWGNILQFPSVATSVTVPFNKSGTGGLNFAASSATGPTVAHLCGIFSGKITLWENVPGSGRTGPIQVVYRAEGSGTSELLGNFLNAACPAETGTTNLTGGTFDANQQSFIANFSTVPTNFVPATGSQAMFVAVGAVDGRIGYVGPDQIATADLADSTKVAQIKGFSPTSANVTLTINAKHPPTGLAATVHQNWAPNFGNPTGGYPIVGFTTFVMGQCYDGADTHGSLAKVLTFLNKHYNATVNNDAAIAAHDFIPLNTEWKTAVRNTFLSNVALIGRDIENSSVCNAIGRPLL